VNFLDGLGLKLLNDEATPFNLLTLTTTANITSVRNHRRVITRQHNHTLSPPCLAYTDDWFNRAAVFMFIRMPRPLRHRRPITLPSLYPASNATGQRVTGLDTVMGMTLV